MFFEDFELTKFQDGMNRLFPKNFVTFEMLTDKVMEGDVIGAARLFFMGQFSAVSDSFLGMRNIFVWIIILGVMSAIITHFIEIFDKHQVADMCFYFLYLMLSAFMLKCFSEISATAGETMENIILFVKLLVPLYLAVVGAVSGGTTAAVYYELLLVLIYGVESILQSVVIPMVYSYMMLSVVNGIWSEEKLNLIMELIEKSVGWILKAALGMVTGVSVFQSLIAPSVDLLKTAAVKKAVGALPGIGSAAESVVELTAVSAIIIKNSIGVVMLILLLALCAAPLFKIFIIAFLIKCAAAFMGIVSDKRITSCANHTADAGFLLFKTAGTAMLLFLISLSVVAASTSRII